MNLPNIRFQEGQAPGGLRRLDLDDYVYIQGKRVKVEDYLENKNDQYAPGSKWLDRYDQVYGEFERTYRSAGWKGSLPISSSLEEKKEAILEAARQREQEWEQACKPPQPVPKSLLSRLGPSMPFDIFQKPFLQFDCGLPSGFRLHKLLRSE